MTLFETAILEKYSEYQYLSTAIDAILDSKFAVIQNNRLQRGIVHNVVSNELNINLNNSFCLLIRERVIAKGGVPYLSMGRLYYKNITERHQTV